MRALTIVMTAVALLCSSAARSEDANYRLYTKNAKFEDVRDDLKDAIIGHGFVIDYVGHVNDMLDRTAEAVGPKGAKQKTPYLNAEYMQFCSAKLTHEAVAADPLAIANCPTAIYVYELRSEPGSIHVGFRTPAVGSSETSKEINGRLVSLFDEIAKEATKK